MIAAASVMILMLAGGAVWALVTRKTQDQITASDATSPPVTQATWVRQADLPVALEGAAVAAYQDKMWVAGGLSNDAARTKLSTVLRQPQRPVDQRVNQRSGSAATRSTHPGTPIGPG